MDFIDDLPFNVLDIVVITVVAISAIMALMRGFFHEALAIAGWVVAAFVTMYGLPYARPIAEGYIPHDTGAEVAAAAALFLGTLVIMSLITHFIAEQIHESRLNTVDRVLGLLFGLARGAVFVVLGFMFLDFFLITDEDPDWLVEARARPYVERGAEMVSAVIPEDLKRIAEETEIVPTTTIAEDTEGEGAGDTNAESGAPQRLVDSLASPEPAADGGPGDPDDGGVPDYSETDSLDLDQMLQDVQ